VDVEATEEVRNNLAKHCI